MTAPASAQLVRRWVAYYTTGLPDEARQDRRDEIDSDLWSQAADAAESGRDPRSVATEVTLRLLFGIPSDLSWRFEQLQIVRMQERLRSGEITSLRGISALAVFGGVAWLVWPLLQTIVGAPWPERDPLSFLLLFTIWTGTWSLAGATIGLILSFQDLIRAAIALLATSAAAVGALSVLGPYQFVFVLPLGSMLAVWQVSRIGVVSHRTARVHATAAIFLVVVIVSLLMGGGDGISSQLLLVAHLSTVIYALSWIVLGRSIRHGVSLREPSIQG